MWESIKVRFVGTDQVRAVRLAALRDDFDRLKMVDGEDLDGYTGRLGAMMVRYTSVGSMLNDKALVKKLLDTVPDRLYPVVTGIEQFCSVAKMTFEEDGSRRSTNGSGGVGRTTSCATTRS